MIYNPINVFNVNQIVWLAQFPPHTVQFVAIIKNSYFLKSVLPVALNYFILTEIKFALYVIVLALHVKLVEILTANLVKINFILFKLLVLWIAE